MLTAAITAAVAAIAGFFGIKPGPWLVGVAVVVKVAFVVLGVVLSAKLVKKRAAMTAAKPDPEPPSEAKEP